MASVRDSVIKLLALAAMWPGVAGAQTNADTLRDKIFAGQGADYGSQAKTEVTKNYDLDRTPTRYTNRWADRAFSRMQYEPNLPEIKPRTRSMAGGEVVTVVLWILLAAGIAAALYFVFRNSTWGAIGRKKKADTGLMTVEESRRSAQDWLRLADQLEAEGKLREAMRALYLAALTALDRARILPLRPWETNWEHCARYEALPEARDLPVRTATATFDRVWYGEGVATREMVAELRGFYGQCAGTREGTL